MFAKYVRAPQLSGVGKAIEDTTHLMNVTDEIILALKFELTQKHFVSKKSALLDKQEK